MPDVLKELRVSLSRNSGYEDVALLVRDITNPIMKDQFLALTPTLTGQALATHDRISLSYFNPPINCLSMLAYASPQPPGPESSLDDNLLESIKKLRREGTPQPASPLLINNPRNLVNFHQGIDNLSPIVSLREILYVCLRSQSGKKIGVLQLINKARGLIGPEDIQLAEDMANLLGNYLSVMMQNFRMVATLERVNEDVEKFHDINRQYSE